MKNGKFWDTLQYLFIFLFSSYCFIVLVQGIKWGGFFEKHLRISPTMILVVAIGLWITNLIGFYRRAKVSSLYKAFILKANRIFLPLLIIYFLVLVLAPHYWFLILHRFYFDLRRIGEAIKLILIMLMILVCLDPIVGQRIIKVKKGDLYIELSKNTIFKIPKFLLFISVLIGVTIVLWEGLFNLGILTLLIASLAGLSVTLLIAILFKTNVF